MRGVYLGLFIGAFPTISMTLASALFSNLQVGSNVEACFQNFAAGLIVAAVASELFPLMLNASPINSMVGITCGFAVGLALIYGVDYVISSYENEGEIPSGSSSPTTIKTHPKVINMEESSVLSDPESTKQLLRHRTRSAESESGDWLPAPVERASQAIAAPNHKQHIQEHLYELSDSISLMESKSLGLLDSAQMSVRESEEAAEKIDEEIHRLQYKLDHCRRLLQGSEIDEWHQAADGSHSVTDGDCVIASMQSASSFWMSKERVKVMRRRLCDLKSSAEHLIEHIQQPSIDKQALQEMHIHMDIMDAQIEHFHASVETAASRWHRDRIMPLTSLGDTLPMGLVVPVVVDCFVDGLLIGVSVALSSKAGIILAAANCLEMAFLGMAYSTRLVKCTGSSQGTRLIALYAPPLLMFLSAGLGALLGDLSQAIPAVFVGFVAFGVVSLLFLVCNELLIEARNAQGEDERWWISIQTFIGVYVVLMLSHVL